MSGITAGQAAYEAFQQAFPAEDWGPWEHLDNLPADEGEIAARPGWEAVAKAAVIAYIEANGCDPVDWHAVVAEAGGWSSERDELRAARDEARSVVAEMCSVLAEYWEGGQDNDQIVQWRERAGIGAGQ